MVGLPLLNGFVGEFLVLSSTFTSVSRGWATAATVTVILGASYMLWLVQRLFYGPESAMTASQPVLDLRFHEIAVLAPLAVLMLAMGVAPNYWLRPIEKSSAPYGFMQTKGMDAGPGTGDGAKRITRHPSAAKDAAETQRQPGTFEEGHPPAAKAASYVAAFTAGLKLLPFKAASASAADTAVAIHGKTEDGR
jgi:formate hydrogenlyase subunit 3/multisubunit Na+/H+ antiporter MnhD subunit